MYKPRTWPRVIFKLSKFVILPMKTLQPAFNQKPPLIAPRKNCATHIIIQIDSVNGTIALGRVINLSNHAKNTYFQIAQNSALTHKNNFQIDKS